MEKGTFLVGKLCSDSKEPSKNFRNANGSRSPVLMFVVTVMNRDLTAGDATWIDNLTKSRKLPRTKFIQVPRKQQEFL